jgi:hypothetical protein
MEERRQRWLRPDDDVDLPCRPPVRGCGANPAVPQGHSDPDRTHEEVPVRLLRSLLSFDPFGPYMRG